MNNQTMGVIFLLVIIILAVIPKMVHNFYNTIIGRLLLISVVIYFTINNSTLGLLMALVIIAALNQYGSFTEGMRVADKLKSDDSTTSDTTTSDTERDNSAIGGLVIGNRSKTIGDDITTETEKEKVTGVDRQDIQNALASKSSNSIPIVISSSNTDEVSASTEGMLGSRSRSKLEGLLA